MSKGCQITFHILNNKWKRTDKSCVWRKDTNKDENCKDADKRRMLQTRNSCMTDTDRGKKKEEGRTEKKKREEYQEMPKMNEIIFSLCIFSCFFSVWEVCFFLLHKMLWRKVSSPVTSGFSCYFALESSSFFLFFLFLLSVPSPSFDRRFCQELL